MAVRFGAAWRLIAVAAAMAAGAATLAAQAQTRRPWVVERLADGHPDFHGVWANNTVTPLQRPAVWANKTKLTDKEVAELQEVAKQIYDNDGDAQFGDGLINAILEKITKPGSYDPGTGNYNQFWIAGRDWHDRRTSLITDPPDGRLPAMTPEGQKRRGEEIAYRRAHAFEDPEMFPLGERCVNFGWPKIGAGYNSYMQIVQAPNHVMIMAEMAHDARIIPTDGRARTGARSYNGDPRGHWEGDTLVVETINFSPKSDFMGSHENLKLVEKFTRVERDILNYEFTVTDPSVWTRSWTAMIPLLLKNENIYEYACHEGNEAIPGMLRGHRFQERESLGTRSSK